MELTSDLRTAHEKETTDFVVHEHRAKRAGLHYDLRIRVGDVLKDWVFRKPIALEQGIKRLGIEQEDHHTEWLNFEGYIQEGYGAGELKIWDKGKIENPEFIEGRKMIGDFKGQKLKGKYILLKSDRLNGWLLWRIE